jgi:hypothetical protein
MDRGLASGTTLSPEVTAAAKEVVQRVRRELQMNSDSQSGGN